MQRSRILLLGTVFLLVAGCRKDEPAVEPDLGFGYFPTALHSWIEYQVDSLWQDDASNVLDSVSYRLKERIEEYYTDDEGRLCHRIHRYVLDGEGNWVVRDVWTATLGTTVAEATEENLRRLKLVFPVDEGTSWDMNVYNTEDDFTVSYEEVDVPWAANGLNYASTLLVMNTIPPNFVEKRNFEERYALGVGMVSRYREETNTQVIFPEPTPGNPNPAARVEVVGWRLNMVAVAHGTD